MLAFFQTSTRYVGIFFGQALDISAFFQTSTRYVGIFFRQALDMLAFFMKIFFQKSIFGPYTVDNSKHLLNSEKNFWKKVKIWGFLGKISKFSKKFRFFQTNFPENFFSARTSFLLIKTPTYDQIFWRQNQKIDEGVLVEFSNLSETAKSYPLPFETIPQPTTTIPHHPKIKF